ncbi:YslB family protein [Nicoliella spurrieriana]|uniref:YslB family protein n=1 Tax=Nicoliella spurrieriana TaxID=2925830 RepID=A0A976RS21_9LACO|nr:YslB family protein [Nicoliella spurrieriana]UQS86782.1 YslB family protein [Nicoliella spurrieriana]
MNQELYQKFITNPEIKQNWPAALLRDGVISDLLGEDIHSILYWAGKSMARKYATTNPADLITFFEQSGLGHLTIQSENKTAIEWLIDGPIVNARLAVNADADFMFEAGLLAQSVEQQRGLISEAELNKKSVKKGSVVITVHIDPKNTTDEFETVAPFSVISNRKEQPVEQEPMPNQPTNEAVDQHQDQKTK